MHAIGTPAIAGEALRIAGPTAEIVAVTSRVGSTEVAISVTRSRATSHQVWNRRRMNRNCPRAMTKRGCRYRSALNFAE